jgi:hypothetical protein
MAQYDPNKSYSWKPETKFQVTGKEFGLLLQVVKTELSSEAASKVMLYQRLNAALEAILAQAVESEQVYETPVPEKEIMPD